MHFRLNRAPPSPEQRPALPPKPAPLWTRSTSSWSHPEDTFRASTTMDGTGGTARHAPRGSGKENIKEGRGFFKMWGKSERKGGLTLSASVPSTAAPSSALLVRPHASPSLPLGFPSPPVLLPARPHQSAAIAPHQPMRRVVLPSQSTMSTIASSFSLASTNLFTDEWESSSSITSSPGNSPKSRPVDGGTSDYAMWTVRGLSDSPLRTEIFANVYGGIESDEDARESVDVRHRRASTPTPSSVAMLADPETPDDRRGRTSPETSGLLDSPGDADDEVSPPRSRSNGRRATTGDRSLSAQMRIPSIRFEGISMDAVFAEVELKMAAVTSGTAQTFVPSELAMDKRARRRTKVFSDSRPQIEPSPSVSSFSSDGSGYTTRATPIASSSTPVTTPYDVDFRRPFPRRSSSRPLPLDILAANGCIDASCVGDALRHAAGPESLRSPPLSGAFSVPPLKPGRDSSGIFSPRIEGSFSPTPPSPALGEAFVPSPSPALSTTSTFRGIGIELPEVNVVPPTPVIAEGEEWSQPKDYTNGGVYQSKVILLEERRTVRVSTRIGTGGRSDRTMDRKATSIILPHTMDERSPPTPLSPALSVASTTSSSYETPVAPSAATFSASSSNVYQPTCKSTPSAPPNDRAEPFRFVREDVAVGFELPPRTPPPAIFVTSSSSTSLPLLLRDSPLSGGGGKGGDESDDSITRFGDAPLLRGLSISSFALVRGEAMGAARVIERSAASAGSASSIEAETVSSSDGATDSESDAGYESFEGAVVMTGARVDVASLGMMGTAM